MSRKIRILIFILLGCYALSSCSPQKRLNRLVAKHPELIQNDTISFVDTVTFTTEKVHLDTLTSLHSITQDTLIINKENLTIKTFYNYQTDSIYISGQCDTIFAIKVVEHQIPVEKYVMTESKPQWTKLLWGIIIGLAFTILLFFISKYFKLF